MALICNNFTLTSYVWYCIHFYVVCMHSQFIKNHPIWYWEISLSFLRWFCHKEAESVRKMHWMAKGEWYHIGYGDFASRFSFRAVNAHRPRIHTNNPLKEEEMKLMYALRQEMNAGNINDLYNYYLILNRLFRKTICPRDGDPTNIS
jgi:hypothetical protein